MGATLRGSRNERSVEPQTLQEPRPKGARKRLVTDAPFRERGSSSVFLVERALRLSLVVFLKTDLMHTHQSNCRSAASRPRFNARFQFLELVDQNWQPTLRRLPQSLSLFGCSRDFHRAWLDWGRLSKRTSVPRNDDLFQYRSGRTRRSATEARRPPRALLAFISGSRYAESFAGTDAFAELIAPRGDARQDHDEDDVHGKSPLLVDPPDGRNDNSGGQGVGDGAGLNLVRSTRSRMRRFRFCFLWLAIL